MDGVKGEPLHARLPAAQRPQGREAREWRLSTWPGGSMGDCFCQPGRCAKPSSQKARQLAGPDCDVLLGRNFQTTEAAQYIKRVEGAPDAVGIQDPGATDPVSSTLHGKLHPAVVRFPEGDPHLHNLRSRHLGPVKQCGTQGFACPCTQYCLVGSGRENIAHEFFAPSIPTSSTFVRCNIDSDASTSPESS